MTLQAHRNRRAPGIMLIECMVYLAAVVLVLGLAFALFHTCSDQYVGLRRNAEDITRALHAGERWRDDIRRATAPVGYLASDPRPMWRIPQRDTDVYYLLEAGSLWRFASSNSVPEEVLGRVLSSEMRDETRGEVRCCAWAVELKSRLKGPHVRPVFHFLAVPNGKVAP
jgi:hypothetical protein